jgi:hypothetical protein
MFIVPKDGESQQEFLSRVEQATQLLGGKSLYSLMQGKKPAKEQEPIEEDEHGNP